MGSLLSVILKFPNLFTFDSTTIAKVSEESGLLSLGCLILEEYIINTNSECTRQLKRKYGDDVDENLKYWIRLAE